MTASAEPDGSRLLLTGWITAGNAPAIRSRSEGWLDSLSSGTQASVDLSSVTAASSVVLSLLLCLRRRAGQRQVSLTFAGASDDVISLSRLNGVSRWLTGS